MKQIVEILDKEPSLTIFDQNKLFYIFVDTSQQGTGAFLTQRDDQGKHPLIDCFSKRKISKKPPTYLELTGLRAAIKKWRPFLYNLPFVVYTDHRPLTGKNVKEEKLILEFAKLDHLEFTIEYIEGKNHFLADFLSRSPASLMVTKKKKTEAQKLDEQEKRERQKIKQNHFKEQKQLQKKVEEEKRKKKKEAEKQNKQDLKENSAEQKRVTYPPFLTNKNTKPSKNTFTDSMNGCMAIANNLT